MTSLTSQDLVTSHSNVVGTVAVIVALSVSGEGEGLGDGNLAVAIAGDGGDVSACDKVPSHRYHWSLIHSGLC